MKYRNSNRGRLWPNDRKRDASQPDYEGTINVKGEEFLISAWKPKPDGGNSKGLSFSVRPKRRRVLEQPKDYIVDPATAPEHHPS